MQPLVLLQKVLGSEHLGANVTLPLFIVFPLGTFHFHTRFLLLLHLLLAALLRILPTVVPKTVMSHPQMDHETTTHPELLTAQVTVVAVVPGLGIRRCLMKQLLVHLQNVPIGEREAADVALHLFLHLGRRVFNCLLGLPALLGDDVDALVDLLVYIVLLGTTW